jgi:hypothetical protein
VLRPRRGPVNLGEQDAGPFQKSIGYREYAQWVGPLGLAFNVLGEQESEWLIQLLLNVNYLGKRGGFVQWIPPAQWADALPPGFVHATTDQLTFSVNGTLQLLDDCTPRLTFEKANIYSDAKIRTGTDRLARHIVLPNFRLVRSSKAFTLYERVNDE